MGDSTSFLVARSLELIADHQAASGAYVASPNFGPYAYSWLRDGAFIADAMSRHGRIDSAEAFFGWCAGILTDRREQVERLIAAAEVGQPASAAEHLHTRYTLDGAESDEPWENFQLDGYGTWLWALVAHVRRHGRPCDHLLDGVELSTRYIAACWREPSYDWWEEHAQHRHTSTLASIHGGLTAVRDWGAVDRRVRERAATAAEAIHQVVADVGVHDGHLTKWLGATEVDASLIACATPFRLYDPSDEVMRATVARIERELAPGGVHRYLDDTYYGGGEWVLLAGFLGWYHAEAGDTDRANDLLVWMAAQANGDGELPEQVDTHLLHPDRKAEWDERWGPIASPLLWSHAMFLTLASVLDAAEDPMYATTDEVPL